MHHHNQYHSHYPAESRLETQLTETKCHLVEPNINCSIHFDHLITFLQKVGRHESSVPVLLSIVSMQHNMHITPEFNTAKNRLIFLLMCRSNTGTNNSYRYFIGLWLIIMCASTSISLLFEKWAWFRPFRPNISVREIRTPNNPGWEMSGHKCCIDPKNFRAVGQAP